MGEDIEDLRKAKEGLEALLCDAQAEIAELKAALRPFAEACRDGSDVALSEVPLKHFKRAAELVPAENT